MPGKRSSDQAGSPAKGREHKRRASVSDHLCSAIPTALNREAMLSKLALYPISILYLYIEHTCSVLLGALDPLKQNSFRPFDSYFYFIS